MPNSPDSNAQRISPPASAIVGLILPGLLAIACTPRESRGAEISPNAAASAGRDFFESKVRPLLVENCQACHGAQKQKGGLRVDARAALLTGGDSGPAIVPGRPAESLIVRAIQYSEDLKMPPKGKLGTTGLSAVKEWIAAGAPWPDSGPIPAPIAATVTAGARPATGSEFTPEQKGFWAFRPPVDRPIPEVKQSSWVQSPIDAFILAGLEAKGLKPAPAADRRALIRRATFDLIGLPPTPEEVAAFEKDRSPDAFARVVDRLLASPHHGERWGRHWLDVARYADSNGMDENLAFANAWRYRDYVVRAFNADRPYDRFVAEQIAGDLLDDEASDSNQASAHDRLIATGFLVFGPKMLAEDDPMKMEMDIIDEQVDTIGRTFLGLTMGCARCHDHKFDPIKSADYYGMAGIFKSTRTMEHFKVVARWNERPLSTPAEQARKASLEKRAVAIRAEIDKIVKEAGELVKAAHLKEPGAPPLPRKLEPLFPQSVRDRLKALRDERTAAGRDASKIPSAMSVADREAVDLKVHIRGSHLTLGPVAPRRFPAILTGGENGTLDPSGSGRRQLADWLASPDNPLPGRVMANRLWLWHFGAALVRTPDNFGRLGERPTHPELLDWLARAFVREGWSMKRMHRAIMLSSAYQMGTDHDAEAASVDPENRLWWRMNRRRLEAESIRDSILAVSGRLETPLGGTLLKTPNREYVTGTASLNGESYRTGRRSIYLPIIRSALFEIFQAFDFADPSTPNGQRDTTTVAPQALCLMNSDLVADSSRALADGVLSDETRDDNARVARIYSLAYGRAPSPAETARALAFMGRYERSPELQSAGPADARCKAWRGFCRAIFESSEFIYVD